MVFGEIGDPPRPTAAMFRVVLDEPMTLEVGGDIDHTFEFELFPAPFQGPGVPSVITFYLIRADDLRLQVSLNGRGFIREFRPGPTRSVHGVIDNGARHINELTLRVLQGSFRFSDLVLWYQVR